MAMSNAEPTPETSTPGTSSPVATLPASSIPKHPKRVLACTLCHQRKVKCDRRFPCANCTKSRVECVPATAVRPRRRRRIPERDILERLGRYEEILRRHNIEFEPFGKDSAPEKLYPRTDATYASDDDRQSEAVFSGPPSPLSTTSTTEKIDKTMQYDVKYVLFS